MSNKLKREEIDILEDDEFEEFPFEQWDKSNEAPQDEKEWEDDWEDEDKDEFSKKLRIELKKDIMDTTND